MSRTRNYCFTSFKDEPPVFDPKIHSYLCFGKEICPTTGMPHFQCFVVYKHAKTFSAVQKLLVPNHVEVCKGTAVDNIGYCRKEGSFFEFGTAPVDLEGKGRMEKDRWRSIIDLARAGDWEALSTLFPDVYATRLPVLENLRRKRPIKLETIDGELDHEWIVGETGCGKSKRVRDENPGAYIKDPETSWWDDYDFEDTVIIDDFDKYQKGQGGNMKRWLDRYVFPAQVKGGYMKIRPRKVIVTSQYTPQEIWDDQKTVDAINRRCKVVHVGPVPVPERRLELQSLKALYGVSGSTKSLP